MVRSCFIPSFPCSPSSAFISAMYFRNLLTFSKRMAQVVSEAMFRTACTTSARYWFVILTNFNLLPLVVTRLSWALSTMSVGSTIFSSELPFSNSFTVKLSLLRTMIPVAPWPCACMAAFARSTQLHTTATHPSVFPFGMVYLPLSPTSTKFPVKFANWDSSTYPAVWQGHFFVLVLSHNSWMCSSASHASISLLIGDKKSGMGTMDIAKIEPGLVMLPLQSMPSSVA
mmetsp:Transcript_87326/g.245123  ORF Transcript_87326/g.245123 Transcript_87326/m.245123 type:complete len:228 (-) Transcript_87326:1812-2495(-)